jgi:hypothetical protein
MSVQATANQPLHDAVISALDAGVARLSE